MKVFGKWLVIANVNGKNGVASSFMTKKDAIESLETYFERKSDNLWTNKDGIEYHIEKNVKEYGRG